jgi:hypothetical protein
MDKHYPIIKQIKVRNMISLNGNPVANQFIINTDYGRYFQSYDSIIAFKRDGRVYLDRDKWDYSRTTGKYRNIFLGEDKKQTEAKIRSQEYTLMNLNI